MAQEKSIMIPEDAWKCLNALEEAIDSMAESDHKKKAEAAVKYLTALFNEETLPSIFCPVGSLIIR